MNGPAIGLLLSTDTLLVWGGGVLRVGDSGVLRVEDGGVRLRGVSGI